jgi:branched-chain amino acid transport system ATP-binding protein
VSSEALLVLDGVGKRFNGLTVLDNVSFTLAPGEILGLVGPNGSGKTTAINVISGIHHADGGHLRFAGQPIDRVPTFRRVPLGINRTFQVPKPFEIDLAAHANVLASDLTVNQQKMLDLGRALATQPKLLLVDEIGAGLNPSELAVMADLLCKLAARGIALIVVEHLLDFLNRITNRVIVLGAGCVLFEGTLTDASRNPDVVAAFIGG